MKKTTILISLVITLIITLLPIQAKESMNILITIKNDKNYYVAEITDQKIKIKTIPSKLYIPIVCLDYQKEALNDVDFSNINACLINSINKALNLSIDYYVSLDMPTLLKELDLPKDSYDYKTLKSLTKTAEKIKDNFSFSLLLHYKDFIETNMGLKELYNLYKTVNNDNLKITYYYLNYFKSNDVYLAFDTTFHKKKK